MKFSDCHFFLQEKLEQLPSWVGSVNPSYASLDQFQRELVNLGLMVLEAANLQQRPTLKLQIYNK